MAQETKPLASKEKHCSRHQRQDEITPADDEIEEIEIPQKATLYDKVTQVMEKFASTRLGQMIVERTDRVLKVIEDTARWSLPQDDKDVPLARPLPWMFFLILIVWLRVLRIGLSAASFVVGSQRVTPQSMVYYIQTKRRRLRAIRVSGLKSIRSREIESTIMGSSSSGQKVTFVGKLRTLLGSAVCKPGQHREVPARRVFIQSGNAQGSKDMSERSSKRPRDDESADLNLTVDQMLDKYAVEDSDADSDYIPKEDEDEVSSSSSCNSSSSDETEKENNEKIDETTKDSEKLPLSKNDDTPMDQSLVEIKENCGTHHRPMPKPIVEIKLEPLSDVDSGNELMQTPKENTNAKGPGESDNSGTATEVANQQKSTPITSRNQLAAPQIEEEKQKGTPGHESAASLKPIISKTATAADSPANDISVEKCYRTITTQTAIEFDWSITLKTKVSHIKTPPPKLEKLDCSVQLTPASSMEDVFYSPIGSPQDFHSIFHPAPIVKGTSKDAHSTNKVLEGNHTDSASAETSETNATNQRKTLNNTNLNHNKPNYYHNAKNRNKNRR